MGGPLGHAWVLDFLKRSLQESRATHAYLLTGRPQVGKFTTALAMAQVLLCEKGAGCGACRHCRLVLRQTHPDLRVLQQPADRRIIPIRDVHELIHGIALRPLEAARKVYIVDGADALSPDGADALLKNLEEPPPAVTWILTAADASLLPPTVVSRCQRLVLRPVPTEELRDYLVEQHGLDPSAADSLALASGGCAGWAIRAAEQPEILEDRRRWRSQLLELFAASRLERIRAADSLAERWPAHAHEVREVFSVWTDLSADLVRAQSGLSPRTGLGDGGSIEEIAQALSPEAARGSLDLILRALQGLEANASPRLTLETLLLSLPRIQTAPPTDPFVARGASPPEDPPGSGLPLPSPPSGERPVREADRVRASGAAFRDDP